MKYFTKNFLAVVILLFTLGFTAGNLFSQTFQWASTYQGVNNVFGQDVETNSSGEIISVGYFFGTADFDPSGATANLTSPGQQDIFVTKLDAIGNLVWAQRFGNSSRNRANNVTVDSYGDIYVTGYFEGVVDFDPGPGTATLTSQFVVTAFILKLDTDGNFLWVRQFGGSAGVSEGLEVVTDSNDDLIVGGYFTADCDFNPSGGGLVYNSAAGRDGYIAKLTSSGGFLWARHVAGDNDNRVNTVALDNNDNIFFGGFFSGQLDFDQFNPGTQTESSGSGPDIFVASYDNNGMHNWSTSIVGTGNNQVNRLSVNRNGNVFLTGQFENTLDFDPGTGVSNETSSGALDSYILSLDNTGAFNWVQPIGGGTNDLGLGVSNGPDGTVYATGYYNGTAFFDGISTMNTLGGNTIYIAKYLEGGALEWTERIGGAGNDFGFNLVVDDNWDVLSTGYFNGSSDFDPDGGGSVIGSVGGSDAFVHKLSQTCVAPIITGTGTLISMLCPGVQDSTRVFVDGTLNDAVEWAWYEGSCGGTYLGSGDSLTVRPTVTTTYFVRPEGQCGAPATCQTVTVNVDNTAPVITLTTPITENTDPGSCYYPSASLTSPTVTDADCGVDTLYNDADVILLVGTTTVTWTAIDVNGNISTATQDVTVEDVELPTITAPTDVTVSADAICQATGVILGSSVSNDNCTVTSVTNDAPATFTLGTTIVTWTVTDASGNVNTDTQNVTVIDDIDPLIIGLPTDITVNNDVGNCSAIVSWTAPTTTDNCAGSSISQISGITNGNAFPVGTSTVVYEALDGSGNSVSGSFDVTVIDSENPVISAPIDVTVSANQNCFASGVVLGSETSSDNCGIASVTNDAPSIYPLGVTTVTWTITDDAGNISTDTQDVLVEDTDAPTVIAPANITVVADASCLGTVASLGTPITDDNCSVASVTNDALANYPLGNTTVTWTVTDGSGNISTAAQIITVVDETDPLINALPADINVSNDAGVCNAVVNWTEPTVTDNCTGASISQTAGIANGGSFPVGTTLVEYTALDGSGNTVVATFNVTVNDAENPTIVAAPDTTIAANNFCTALNVVLDMPTINDNCGVLSVTNDAPILYNLDSTLVTWTITDINGNTATATQFVIIADSTAPSISAPLPVTAYVDTLCQTSIDTLGTPITSDNCAVDTVYNDAPAIYTTGNYVITWYAEDAAGNIDSTTQVVTIIDTIRPEPILVDTTLILDPAGPISLFGSDIDAGSTDNCGVDVVILEQNSFDCNDLGTNTVGVRVIDINGNVYDTSIVVTVEESGIDLDFDQIDDACDDNVNTTTVIVPSGFTPNGDGINDQLIIPALSNYTTINLVVYNRYGNVVYEASPYANDWDGTNGKSGMELPDGTYFYTLELDGGEILNGYIYINRTL